MTSLLFVTYGDLSYMLIGIRSFSVIFALLFSILSTADSYAQDFDEVDGLEKIQFQTGTVQILYDNVPSKKSVGQKGDDKSSVPASLLIQFEESNLKDVRIKGLRLVWRTVDQHLSLEFSRQVEIDAAANWVQPLVNRYGLPKEYEKEFSAFFSQRNQDLAPSIENRDADKISRKNKDNTEKKSNTELEAERKNMITEWLLESNRRLGSFLDKIKTPWPKKPQWREIFDFKEKDLEGKTVPKIQPVFFEGTGAQGLVLLDKQLGEEYGIRLHTLILDRDETGTEPFNVTRLDSLSIQTLRKMEFDSIGSVAGFYDLIEDHFAIFGLSRHNKIISKIINIGGDFTQTFYPLPDLPISGDANSEDGIVARYGYQKPNGFQHPDVIPLLTVQYPKYSEQIYHLHPKNESLVGETEKQEVEEERHHLIWMKGKRELQDWFHEKLVGVKPVVGDALDSTFKNIATQALSSETENRILEEVPALGLYQVSISSLFDGVSLNLRIETAARAHQVILSEYGNSEKDTHLYIRIPDRPGVGFVEDVLHVFATHTDLKYINGERLFVYFDVIGCDDSKFKKLIDKLSIQLEHEYSYINLMIIGTDTQLEWVNRSAMVTDYFHEKSTIKISLDPFVDSEQRIDSIVKFFSNEKIYVDAEYVKKCIKKISTGIDPESPLQQILNSPNDFARNLLGAYRRGLLIDEEAPSPARTVGIFIKDHSDLSGLSFPARVAEVTLEFRNRLSANSPKHGKDPLIGLDRILYDIQKRLRAWFSYGHIEVPYLYFTFMGIPSVGKTKLAKDIAAFYARELGSVAFGQIDFSKYRKSSATAEWRNDKLYKQLQGTIEKLRLDPSLVKILLMDEVHERKDMIELIKSSVGDGDRKNARLNFDGLIVIAAGNIPRKGKAHGAVLEKINGSWDRSFRTALYNLFKASYLSNGEDEDKMGGGHSSLKIDAKTLDATASRLITTMYYIPDTNSTEEGVFGNLETVIGAIEERHQSENLEIIVDTPARDYLTQKGQQYEIGGKRAVLTAMKELVYTAIVEAGGKEALRGRMILRLQGSLSEDGEAQLRFVSADRDLQGSVSYLNHRYAKISSVLNRALSHWVEGSRSALSVSSTFTNEDQSLRIAQRFLSGFNSLSSQPLFSFEGDTPKIVFAMEEAFRLPLVYENVKNKLIRAQFVETVNRWLELIFNYNNRNREIELSEILGIMEEVKGFSSLIFTLGLKKYSNAKDRGQFDRWIRKADKTARSKEISLKRTQAAKDAESIISEFIESGKNMVKKLRDLSIDHQKFKLISEFTTKADIKIGIFRNKYSQFENLLENLNSARDRIIQDEMNEAEAVLERIQRNISEERSGRVLKATDSGMEEDVLGVLDIAGQASAAAVLLDTMVRAVMSQEFKAMSKNEVSPQARRNGRADNGNPPVARCHGSFSFSGRTLIERLNSILSQPVSMN